VTIDYDGLTDNTVTIRERDGMTQQRVNLDQLVNYIQDHMANWKSE
jgi:glycyl-tRNA synthetase